MEVSCSDSFGIGIEGATLIKPCCDLNNPDGFTRGNKIYKCSNKSWKIERNDCLSAPINNLLTGAEVTFMSFLEAGGGGEERTKLFVKRFFLLNRI